MGTKGAFFFPIPLSFFFFVLSNSDSSSTVVLDKAHMHAMPVVGEIAAKKKRYLLKCLDEKG